VVICLKRDADLHTAQLMPLPLTASCYSKIQIGFTFLVPAHPGSPGKRAVKRVCVCATEPLPARPAKHAFYPVITHPFSKCTLMPPRAEICYGHPTSPRRLLLLLTASAQVSLVISRAIDRMAQPCGVGTVALTVLWPCSHIQTESMSVKSPQVSIALHYELMPSVL